ncbi:MAG: hypothetical protein M3Z64_12140 [Verrucomicrobiota bacterium]|nr:hypothetical protein [Verrucomicrobiota bacterium]
MVAFSGWVLANARAGDAVAIGYNTAGVWTAVTYYSSSTPKGGTDYKEASGARDAALRDLKKRAGEDLARGLVLASSDRTGYFAYARGKTDLAHDVHVVGRGNSEAAAEKDAMARLQSEGATIGRKVIYHYFSYGSEPSAVHP